MSIIEYVGSIGGIGGVLAFLIFMAYRYLVRQMREDRIASQSQIREDRKYMEDRLTGIMGDYNKASKSQQRVTVKHTKVLTELITWLKAKNGSM